MCLCVRGCVYVCVYALAWGGGPSSGFTAALDHHVTMKPWRNLVTVSFCSFHFNISVTLSETGNMFPLPLWFWKSLPCSVSSGWLRSNLDLSQCRTLSQNSRSEQASSIDLPFSGYCQDLPAPQQWPIEEYLVLFLCKLISWHIHTQIQ